MGSTSIPIVIRDSGSSQTFLVQRDGVFSEDGECSEDRQTNSHSYQMDALTFCRTLLKTLQANPTFRSHFIHKHRCFDVVHFDLDRLPSRASLDYKSCRLVSEQLWQEIETEDALNWLSTLGGAYSNLGEHSQDFAKRAGDNAMKQMAIVVKSQQGRTPSVVLRCWLFVAMSAMQQGRLKDARQIIRYVYHTSKYRLSEVDWYTKIEQKCMGTWSRLAVQPKMPHCTVGQSLSLTP